MAIYRFGAEQVEEGTSRYYKKIEFEYDEDVLKRCWIDDNEISPQDATFVFNLDSIQAPGYVPQSEPNTRQNALDFLVWDAFLRPPKMFGDPGEFDMPEDNTPEGAVN